MINKDNCIKVILNEIPLFAIKWEEYRKYWKGEIGLCNDLAEFARFLIDKIIDNEKEEVEKGFKLIEMFLLEADAEVQGLVETCVLENIVNTISLNKVDGRKLIGFMGNKTINYCMKYDLSTGSSSQWLWGSSFEVKISDIIDKIKEKINGPKTSM